ncbi:MAG: 2-phosphosulfolactate phosphatase [Deltaproteobacteria bacterium]|nr:2-phosphosulfolactate phosphatase [Deltaproteobacteria bacterium]MBP6831072.1 2-phosphosulfolactate phosphatase [Deltaproteobacteria bacterium]
MIIDAFRAFATACYVLDRRPADYLVTTSSAVAARLAREVAAPLLVGKAEIGADFAYEIPNSPTRTLEVTVAGRTVIHRTQAGAMGVVQAVETELVLAASLVNAAATARYLWRFPDSAITLVPMGHEAITPSLEDDLCRRAIASHLQGRPFDLAPFIPALRDGSGRYFFGDDQRQYPREDFERCIACDRFDFAIRAERHGDYARLVRC